MDESLTPDPPLEYPSRKAALQFGLDLEPVGFDLGKTQFVELVFEYAMLMRRLDGFPGCAVVKIKSPRDGRATLAASGVVEPIDGNVADDAFLFKSNLQPLSRSLAWPKRMLGLSLVAGTKRNHSVENSSKCIALITMGRGQRFLIRRGPVGGRLVASLFGERRRPDSFGPVGPLLSESRDAFGFLARKVIRFAAIGTQIVKFPIAVRAIVAGHQFPIAVAYR